MEKGSNAPRQVSTLQLWAKKGKCDAAPIGAAHETVSPSYCYVTLLDECKEAL
jgi:hypothetical protein